MNGQKTMVYIYNGILFSHSKEGNAVICDKWMNPKRIMVSETSQRKKKSTTI